ncbi:TetR/AcrR family transcriptional regulator [Streptomyces sp. NPDC056486]|uniref:TetR/AcrR family transcriptional regulator n=1 Tax=Streptomyces sp. NPDC056486 TaxID=3345835 RepID=UPI003679A956
MPGQRSDARRNYARILEVAEAEVADRGTEASLEQIARTAGVGSATVRRHFPTRQALLEAVFHERIQTLAEQARVGSAAKDSRAALLSWMHDLLAYAVSARGLADALAYEPPVEDAAPDSCAAVLEAAGTPLLRRAIDDGAVRSDFTFRDLITLTAGIALATEHEATPLTHANHLLQLTIQGVGPAPID